MTFSQTLFRTERYEDTDDIAPGFRIYIDTLAGHGSTAGCSYNPQIDGNISSARSQPSS